MKFPAVITKGKNPLRGNPLKLVGLFGLAASLALAWTLVIFLATRDTGIFPRKSGENFFRNLERYDTAFAAEKPENLEKRLDSLEKIAKTQDDWLSILKRRRLLAAAEPDCHAGYLQSAEEAFRIFPFSEVMAAIAGEALIQGPLTGESETLLMEYAQTITQRRFFPLALGFNVLANALETPEIATKEPRIEALFSAELSPGLEELIFTNSVLLGLLRNTTQDQAIRINELLRTRRDSNKFLWLGGEFFYDHGNPLRAAGFFSQLGDDFAGRTADALAMAGQTEAARTIWTVFANSPEETPENRIRSLYNLAATSRDETEAAFWLEKIFTSESKTGLTAEVSAAKTSAVIRYSRLQNSARSITLLEEVSSEDPLLDLELLRRQRENRPLDRTAAEVWLLLGRHPESEALYQWGAWFFDRQKMYSETAQLVKIAGQKNITAPWINFCRALTLIREGNINEGAALLEAEYETQNPDWRIPANLAGIAENRRQISSAAALYEAAAAIARQPKDSSLLQLRLSRCFEALGKFEESRTALELALKLDPDNVTVRMELWRQDRR